MNSISFSKRLCCFYAVNHEQAEGSMSPIWSGIFHHRHNKLHQALCDGNGDLVSSMLKVKDADIIAGFDNLQFTDWETNALLNTQLSHVATMAGLRPLFNPAQPVSPQRMSSKELLEDIKDFIGFDPAMPIQWFSDANVGLHERSLIHVLAAISLVRYIGRKQISVVEIGPGCGLFAWVIHSMSKHRYVAVDLPIGCVVVAWALAACFGEDAVGFYGEDRGNKKPIYIVPPWGIQTIPFKPDAIVNCDSFPEIPNATQDYYLSWAVEALPSNGIIYSINHESTQQSQRSFRSAILTDGTLRTVSRHMFPLRNGYVEEIFKP